MTSFPLTHQRWQFRNATRRTPWRSAIVPGCVHRDLLRHKLIPDPFWGRNELELRWIEECDWEYRCHFAVTGALLAKEIVDLVADGLDTVATVTLNDHHVAAVDNMFIGHRWNVKSCLRPGRNELRVRFASAAGYIRANRPEHQPQEFNDPVGRCSVLRKQQCQFGWDWGPRLVTAGIWRDIRLEGWSGNRIESVRVSQRHSARSVALEFTPELTQRDAGIRVQGTLSLDGRNVAQIENKKTKVENPQLWWPNGHGAQPLYIAHLKVFDGAGRSLGAWSHRLGLRTVTLDRHADEAGETFQFVVNRRPIFAKGANWIPAHSFAAGLTRTDYARDLRAATQAHMNMIRVWGGGIYESEDFYDLCDELGLLVWQDFMFASTLYPGDEAFLRSVRTEAAYQVRRLRDRACLALWCGNNELIQNNADLLQAPELRSNYDALFHGVLPHVVQTCDGVTEYRPSSPWRGNDDNAHANGEKRGDTHYWDVWHFRAPIKDYEKWRFRFVAEFGMQSFCSPETQATCCRPPNDNLFGPEMENHQKNRGGNQRILDYVSQRYRLPKSQDDLIYLSQLNQAYAMQTAVEHYRRQMPHCMGALYWQLNDCWPVASWSSIEFTGRWRAQHYAARRSFAPVLVCAHAPVSEEAGIGNYRIPGATEMHLHTVSDRLETTPAILRWQVARFDGRVLARGSRRITLRYGESKCWHTLDLSRLIARHGRDVIYLRVALVVNQTVASEQTTLLAPPRFLALLRGRTSINVRALAPKQFAVTFRSTAFQHGFAFDVVGEHHAASDNFFDLHPQETKSVIVTCSRPQPTATLRQRIRFRSLADTY